MRIAPDISSQQQRIEVKSYDDFVDASRPPPPKDAVRQSTTILESTRKERERQFTMASRFVNGEWYRQQVAVPRCLQQNRHHGRPVTGRNPALLLMAGGVEIRFDQLEVAQK